MEQPDDLRRFDVHPFPLRVAVHWADTGFQVELVVVTSVEDTGYSSIPVATHTVAYTSGFASQSGAERAAERDAAVRAAVEEFARGLAAAFRA